MCIIGIVPMALWVRYKVWVWGTAIDYTVYPNPGYFWPLCITLIFMAIAPWVPRRFSLAAIFTVMTAIALGLGVIVWISSFVVRSSQ